MTIVSACLRLNRANTILCLSIEWSLYLFSSFFYEIFQSFSTHTLLQLSSYLPRSTHLNINKLYNTVQPKHILSVFVAISTIILLPLLGLSSLGVLFSNPPICFPYKCLDVSQPFIAPPSNLDHHHSLPQCSPSVRPTTFLVDVQ